MTIKYLLFVKIVDLKRNLSLIERAFYAVAILKKIIINFFGEFKKSIICTHKRNITIRACAYVLPVFAIFICSSARFCNPKMSVPFCFHDIHVMAVNRTCP